MDHDRLNSPEIARHRLRMTVQRARAMAENPDADPSGAEMRSPNDPCCAHVRVSWRTEQVKHDFGPRQDRDVDLSDPNVRPFGVQLVTRGWWECDSNCGTRFAPVAIPAASEPEVSPRSSGGAPNDARLEQLANRIERYCDNGRPNDGDALRREAAYLRTVAAQVSALRQEAAARPKSSEPNVVRLEQLVSRIERYCDTHPADEAALRREVAYLGTIAVNVDTLRHTLAAARQEAETLTRQRDAAIREISVIAREAETLRKQLGEAVQAADDANQEEAFVRRALDSQALDYEAVSREAETLRSQLDAAQKDVARLNWMETLESESEESENAQPSIWISRRGVWNGDRLVAQWWEAQVGRSADCGGLSIREAIDAARVAAPREPK